MVGRILQIILPVFAIVAGGWVYGRRRGTDIAGLNRMNMEVFLPALIVGALSSRSFDLASNARLVLAGAGVVLGSGLVAWPVARWLGSDPRTFVPPMMFNNSGNMGLPLALLAFGEAHLPAAVALFVTSNLLHFTVGAHLVRRDAHVGRLLLSPMVLATAVGLALSAGGLGLPGWVGVAVRMVGDVAVPLMLFTLGVRMAATAVKGWRVGVAVRMVGDVAVPLMLFTLGVRMAATAVKGWRVGLAGALVRPLAGLAIALPLGRALALSPAHLALLTLFASLPPAVLNFLIAEEYRQEPEQVASIVLVGHLASLAFVPLALALALRGP